MNSRSLLLALGASVTTFLLAGAAAIESLGTAFGGPGVGILGVAAGLFLGLLVAVAVALTAHRLPGRWRTLLAGYGSFGVAFLAVAALRYVNAPGADEAFTFPVHVATSVLVALVVVVVTGRRRPVSSESSV